MKHYGTPLAELSREELLGYGSSCETDEHLCGKYNLHEVHPDSRIECRIGRSLGDGVRFNRDTEAGYLGEVYLFYIDIYRFTFVRGDVKAYLKAGFRVHLLAYTGTPGLKQKIRETLPGLADNVRIGEFNPEEGWFEPGDAIDFGNYDYYIRYGVRHDVTPFGLVDSPSNWVWTLTRHGYDMGVMSFPILPKMKVRVYSRDLEGEEVCLRPIGEATFTELVTTLPKLNSELKEHYPDVASRRHIGQRYTGIDGHPSSMEPHLEEAGAN